MCRDIHHAKRLAPSCQLCADPLCGPPSTTCPSPKQAEVLSTLSHRHIVQFYGACTVSPNYGIVTEYAVNGCLFNFLEQNVIDFKQILCWAKQIALGLNYLHTEAPSPVIHRDLKSKNGVCVCVCACVCVCVCVCARAHVHARVCVCA